MNKTINNISAGIRTTPEQYQPHNWFPLDINNLYLTEHGTYIFDFGGNTTTNPQAANGNAKTPEYLIPQENRDNTIIISFLYKSEPIESSSGRLSKEFEDDALLLFQKTFKPLLFDSKGNMKSKQGIEKVFSKIIFSSHCGGANFVNIIINEFYNTLIEKYSPATAEILINKIQYFSYAPYEMPYHNVNGLIIAPYNDPNHSWAKALNLIDDLGGVDNEYPKGIFNKISKAKNQFKLKEFFEKTFKTDTRAISLKSNGITFIIPSSMNPDLRTGDHSRGILSNQSLLFSNTETSKTAKLISTIAKSFFNNVSKNKNFDRENYFKRIISYLKGNPPISKTQTETTSELQQ